MESMSSLRVMWVACFAIKFLLDQIIYHRWLYSKTRSLVLSQTPYLLSIVGWFFLSSLASKACMEEWTGFPLASMCFGVGTFFAVIVYVDIFNNIPRVKVSRGHPAMFLILAPPSVAA